MAKLIYFINSCRPVVATNGNVNKYDINAALNPSIIVYG